MTDTPALASTPLRPRGAYAHDLLRDRRETHIKPEDVLQPDFWRHVASQLRPYDEIIVADG